jgi:branched-subunit amino acid transport protein
MNEWLMIAGMTLVTFLPRYGVLALLGRVQMPAPVFRALNYVPPAVLAAIVVPALIFRDGELHIAPENSYLAAGIVAGVVAWRTRRLLLTIVLGMAALFAWRAIFGT